MTLNRKISLIITLVFGILIGRIITSPQNLNNIGNLKSDDSFNSNRPVQEADNVCPVTTDVEYIDARVKYMPILIKEPQFDEIYIKNVGDTFDSKQLSNTLYRSSDDDVPEWLIKHIDIDEDLKEETVYYGNIAMNHTPHVVYVVKDNVIVFAATGANVSIDEQSYGGINLNQTLDWNKGKYKTTRYELVDNKYKPIWYQISCDLMYEI